MMTKKILIKDPHQISVILDVIHDCWFDKDDILFDPKSSILSIKFKPEGKDALHTCKLISIKKMDSSALQCYLRFHHVESYSVNDKERVGTYDFNTLKYDPALKCISVITGVPIDIKIIVKHFEISIEEAAS